MVLRCFKFLRFFLIEFSLFHVSEMAAFLSTHVYVSKGSCCREAGKEGINRK